ncbi:MAG: hypothetical protein KA436_10100 [Oligoflexales bacterium]|nr:hypothetical protein [Oligoflexales bacterium]
MGSRSAILGSALLFLGLFGCGDNKDNKDNKDTGSQATVEGNNSQGQMSPSSPGGPNGQPALKAKVDLRGSIGLLVIDPSGLGSTLALSEDQSEDSDVTSLASALRNPDSSFFLSDTGPIKGENSLQKLDADGNPQDVITVTTTSAELSSTTQTGTDVQTTVSVPQNTWVPPLPKIVTIAVSPKKELFLHFENAFRFKLPASSSSTNNFGGDQRTDGTYCQLFRVKGGTVEDLKTNEPSADNLECLTADHEIDQWRSLRNAVFQFDAAGNVFFAARPFSQPKTVVYKYARDTGALTEMINANICVQDFLVTPAGGLFYTGTDSCGAGGDGGFFRYVSPSSTGGLLEIARGWWNFIFEPISTATSDKAIFFGPDPTNASAASWNTACIFQFDPAGGSTTALRTSKVITCGDNVWDWVNMRRSSDTTTFGAAPDPNNDGAATYITEAKSRCESSGQIFAGGGSQISAIKQDSTGLVYVIGNMRKKNAGTFQCNIEVRGPHCKLNEQPDLTVSTASACTTKGGSWVDIGQCSDYTKSTSADCFAASASWTRNQTWYSNVKGDLCKSGSSDRILANNWWNSSNTLSKVSAANASENTFKYKLNNVYCQEPKTNAGGDAWTTEYKALGKVSSTDQTLQLLSDVSEQATGLWIIKDKVYYSAYNTTEGKYKLRSFANGAISTLSDNFQVYTLSEGPADNSLYFAGLDFADNAYKFGTLNLTNNEKTQKTGLTGTVQTIVIYAK